MIGSFAELKRAMICERTRAGLAAGHIVKRIGAWRPKLTPAPKADVVENVVFGSPRFPISRIPAAARVGPATHRLNVGPHLS